MVPNPQILNPATPVNHNPHGIFHKVPAPDEDAAGNPAGPARCVQTLKIHDDIPNTQMMRCSFSHQCVSC